MPDVVNVLIRVIVPKAGVGAHLDLPQAAARLAMEATAPDFTAHRTM